MTDIRFCLYFDETFRKIIHTSRFIQFMTSLPRSFLLRRCDVEAHNLLASNLELVYVYEFYFCHFILFLEYFVPLLTYKCNWNTKFQVGILVIVRSVITSTFLDFRMIKIAFFVHQKLIHKNTLRKIVHVPVLIFAHQFLLVRYVHHFFLIHSYSYNWKCSSPITFCIQISLNII